MMNNVLWWNSHVIHVPKNVYVARVLRVFVVFSAQNQVEFVVDSDQLGTLVRRSYI